MQSLLTHLEIECSYSMAYVPSRRIDNVINPRPSVSGKWDDGPEAFSKPPRAISLSCGPFFSLFFRNTLFFYSFVINEYSKGRQILQ